MIRQKVKRQAHTYDEEGKLVPSEYVTTDITVESVGDIIDLLSDCSRGASLFMLPPKKGDNIQQVQVLDLRRASEFHKCSFPIPDAAIGTYKAFIFTIGKHGPFEFSDCYEKQVEREIAEGGRRTAGLTWRDVQRIVQIADNLCNNLEYDKVERMGEEGYYTEILNRFNNTTN